MSMYEIRLEESWVQNRGAACTSACVLAALGAMGASGLPDLAAASGFLAGAEYAAPGLLDYVSLPNRRAPLDLKIEALGRGHGVSVSSLTSVVFPGSAQRPNPDEVLIVHLVYGQEAPERYGTWGWHPLIPSSYSTGGHSVVLAALEGEGWMVLDPNRPALQSWPRPGIATAHTRLGLASS